MSGTLDETLFVLKDYLDPAAVINSSGGVQERFSYDAFGPVRFLNGSFGTAFSASSHGWTFLFHAEFRDEESGLYNYGYRYYHSTLGRWISRDPLEEIGGLNLYKMIHNNPENGLDKFGLSIADCYDSDKVKVHVINRSGGRRTGAIRGHIDLGLPNMGLVGFFGSPNGGSDESSGSNYGGSYTGNLNDSTDEWQNGPTPRPNSVNGKNVSTICELKVCPAQAKAMEKKAREINKNSGKFNICGRNCSTVGSQIIAAGGGDLPQKIQGLDNPQRLIDQLRKQGAKCYTGSTSQGGDGKLNVIPIGAA